MNKKLKRFCSICLCVCLAAGMMIQPAGAFAEVGLSDGKDMKVEITDTSSDYGHGYYVEYTINGIPYRSDIAGSRINQMAFKHMTDEQRAKTIRAYSIAYSDRAEDFGETLSGEMNDWYNEYSGWKEAQQILADRLAEKNFPEYQKRFKNSNAYFRENFEPDCAYAFFLETNRLYEEEKLVFSWAEAAYQCMVRAQMIQTSIAVKSISGDLIQLIVDRALVPNITPAGAGGVTAQINGVIGDYINSLTGTTDTLQDMVIGKRVRAGDARKIIETMADTITLNEKIIQACTRRAHEIKKEVESKYETLYAEYEQKINTMVDEADAEEDAVDEASLVDGSLDGEIVAEINRFNREIEAASSADREAIRQARKNYVQQQYNAAMKESKEWCMLYFGGFDPRDPKAGSIVGDHYANYPKVPEAAYGYFDLYMTDEQAEVWEKGARNYALQMRNYLEKCIEMKQAAYGNAIEARKKYANITGRIDALLSMAKSDIEPYDADGSDEWADSYVREKYLDQIDKYAGIDYRKLYNTTYNKILQEEFGMVQDLGPADKVAALQSVYERMDGTVVYMEDRIRYWEGDFILGVERNMYKLAQFHADVSDEIEDFEVLRKEYRESYNDYNTLIGKRNEVLDKAPQYIKDPSSGEGYDYLSDLFFGDDRTGTAEDVLRIGEETDSLQKEYATLDTQLELSAQELILEARMVKHRSIEMSSYETSNNPALADGIDYWSSSEEDDIFGLYGVQEVKGRRTMDDDRWSTAVNLEYLSHDFNGKTWAHEEYMGFFEDLCDNKEKYETTDSDDYKQLKKRIREIDRKENSFAAEVLEKPGEAADWPDPLDDLIEPLIEEIDETRIAGGIDQPEKIYISDDNLTVDGMEPEKAYTGSPVEQDIRLSVDGVELIQGTDYDISYEDNKDAGIAKMTITGMGKYIGVVEKTFMIVPAGFAGVQAAPLKDQTYTGKAIDQAPELSIDKTVLVNNVDYLYVTKNNKNVGTATVEITGKGNYSGSLKLTFKINPKKSSITKLKAKKKGFTAKWSKVSEQATGYELEVATNSAFTKNKKTYKVAKYDTTSKTIKKLKAKKKYFVRIRTYKDVKEGGKTVPYYSAWSDAKSVKTLK